MTPKLVFLDIDGTLTPPGTNIPPESALYAIRKAQRNGHRIFLCTGRSLAMIAPLLKYSFEGAVAGGGGYVFVGDRVLYDCPMEQKDFETALKLFKENGVFTTVEAKDATWCDDGIAEFMARISGGNSELLRWRKALEQDLGFRPMNEYDGRPVYKMVYVCSDLSRLDPAREALEDRYNFLIQDLKRGDCFNGELVNRKYDKGQGVRMVAEALGFDLSDSIGFGDSMNDVEMIETVGYSVCMANGSPLLKSKADMVCPPVDQDGLARAFASLGLI